MNETNKLTFGDDDSDARARRFSTAARIAFVAIVALYVGVRLWRLTASCLWFDEIFGVHAARHTWGGMLRFAAADIIHPPLFYALLKLWMALGGESLLWLRLLPVLLSIAAIVPLVLLARELRLGAWETNLALLLAAANGYLIKYAQEVRMYSLLLLLALTSLWLFARLSNSDSDARSRRTLAALTLCNLLLVYTHYYGWLVVAAELLLVLVAAARRRRRRRMRLAPFLLSAALLCVAYVPWAYALASGRAEQGRGVAQNIGWVERPTLKDVARFQALLHEPFYFQQSSAEPPYTKFTAPAGFLIFGLPIILLLLRANEREEQEEEHTDTETSNAAGDGDRRAGDGQTDAGALSSHEDDTGAPSLHEDDGDARAVSIDEGVAGEGRGELRWLALAFFVVTPVVFAFALSWLLPQSVWGTRHLIVAAPPYLLLAAAAFVRARPRWLRAALLVALGGWLAWGSLVVMVRREGNFIWCAWETHAAHVRADADAYAGAPVNLYAFEDLVAYHFWYALDAERNERLRVTSVKGVPGLTEDAAYFLPRGFDGIRVAGPEALEGERFWIAFRDTALVETRPPLSLLKERGYRVEQVHETSAQGQNAYLVLVGRQ